MLKVNNLSKSIEGKKVIKNISFSISEGSIVGLVGRNGVGKTTLLRSLVGILDAEQGEVVFQGKNIVTHPEVKGEMVFVPDSNSIFNGYSIKELVTLYEAIYVNFDKEYFYQLLQRFDLPEKRKIRTFSRGMKALLFIILSISTRAKLIILDEPTNGLDAIVKRKILQFLLEEVSESRISLFISSHHLEELEKIADTIIMLKDGEVESIIKMEDAKLQYKKVQVVFKENGLPEDIEQLPNIEILSQIGRVCTFLIRDNTEETVSRLKEKNPLLLEELPMSLEDIFVSALGGDDIV
ncbi:ABC transporter ATP-binding protein [Fredinandcohnia onubensis]|uniref:ABC transporter ATP-binding protein n=1 Tax=Fredinandcohnia onubensis TaxID=1571209 RepID=UPI000C0BBCB8|nr:ABC transporter ATP-binding protein [Fredinandcohnia onubensis]